jgi:hypothetical protein
MKLLFISHRVRNALITRKMQRQYRIILSMQGGCLLELMNLLTNKFHGSARDTMR